MHPTRRLLTEHGFRFSHSLGQNFLFDESLLGQIVDAAQVDSGTNVLEIGPGAGTLTGLLCVRAKRVLAIEIDRALEPVLQVTRALNANLRLVFGDCMKLDLRQLCAEAFGGEAFDVVANLPYYITTPILMRLLEENLPIGRITVMVQKEVAERIVASPGGREYGVLSIAVQYRAKAQIALNVPAAAFTPPPKVDSSVLALEMRSEPPVHPISETGFFRLVRAAFHMRRKTLANNLCAAYPTSKADAEALLERLSLSKTVRAEQLSLENFSALSDALTEL